MSEKLTLCLALPVAVGLVLSMIEPEKAGSALDTAKNGCASSVRRIACGDASATKVKVLPEKSYCAAPAQASHFANPVTNLSGSFTTNP